MTHSPPQLQGRRLIVLGVHGFPEPDPNTEPGFYLDPCSQLRPIREAIEQAAIEQVPEPLSVMWLDCPWILGQGVEELPATLSWNEMDASKHDLAGQPIKLFMGSGTFTNMYLEKFGEWFKNRINEIKSDVDTYGIDPYIVVITYSGGGLLLYRWLEVAAKSIVEKIGSIFCIAAPFCFRPDQMVRFTVTLNNRLGGRYQVHEPSAKPEKIVQYMRPEQLIVLSAEAPRGDDRTVGDNTVLLANGSFRENNFEAPQIFEPPPIVGTESLNHPDPC